MQGFLAELRRRNVLRVAAFYAGASWLLVQIATQVFPFFDISNQVVRLVVIAAVAGFPLALAFSWFYELTPEGLKRESEVDHDAPPQRQAVRRWDRMIIVVLALALLLALVDIVAGRRGGSAAVDAKSLAVLPFENLSDDKANAYFADGVQDEILTRLARIGALKVISRTSTHQYASRPGNLPDIARQLGVANVLEGSVQRAGDTVRVEVQLIRADSDQHLWADSYDRKLDNVFGAESEIAQSVAEALDARLSGEEQRSVSDKPTADPDAYQDYLRGLTFEEQCYSGQGPDLMRRAAASFADAVARDPGFALAWAHLSFVKAYMYFNVVDRSPSELAEIKQAADQAMRLRPDLGESWLAQGYYLYRGKLDFDGGLRAFEQARSRLPNNARVLAAISYIQRRQGKWDEAVANMSEAVRLDPRNSEYLAGLAGYDQALRRFPQALELYARTATVMQDPGPMIAAQAAVYQNEGRLDEAAKLLDPLPVRPDDPATFQIQVQQRIYQRQPEAAIAILQPVLAKPDPAMGRDLVLYYYLLGFMQHWVGDHQAARASCMQALAQLKTLRTSDSDDVLLAQPFAYVYTCLDNRQAALADARRAIELNPNDAVSGVQAELTLAQVEAMFNDADAVVAALPHLLAVPNGATLGDLQVNAIWDPVRADPRFQKLVGGGIPARLFLRLGGGAP